MTLVILYGPPAVGKLTVGTELAKLTGFKLFHNHLAIDIALEMFDFNTPAYHAFKHEIWHAAFRAGADYRLPGMIFTFVYEAPNDDRYLTELMDLLAEHSVKVRFVQLTADTDTLRTRLVDPSRQQYRKLNNVGVLNEYLATDKLLRPMPFEPTVAFDTTHTPPVEVARQIQAHYQLPIVEEGQ
jgi:hypothetical protein